jgi:hypothetical protein
MVIAQPAVKTETSEGPLQNLKKTAGINATRAAGEVTRMLTFAPDRSALRFPS